jgi:hypothetical protein
MWISFIVDKSNLGHGGVFGAMFAKGAIIGFVIWIAAMFIFDNIRHDEDGLVFLKRIEVASLNDAADHDICCFGDLFFGFRNGFRTRRLLSGNQRNLQ